MTVCIWIWPSLIIPPSASLSAWTLHSLSLIDPYYPYLGLLEAGDFQMYLFEFICYDIKWCRRKTTLKCSRHRNLTLGRSCWLISWIGLHWERQKLLKKSQNPHTQIWTTYQWQMWWGLIRTVWNLVKLYRRNDKLNTKFFPFSNIFSAAFLIWELKSRLVGMTAPFNVYLSVLKLTGVAGACTYESVYLKFEIFEFSSLFWGGVIAICSAKVSSIFSLC